MEPASSIEPVSKLAPASSANSGPAQAGAPSTLVTPDAERRARAAAAAEQRLQLANPGYSQPRQHQPITPGESTAKEEKLGAAEVPPASFCRLRIDQGAAKLEIKGAADQGSSSEIKGAAELESTVQPREVGSGPGLRQSAYAHDAEAAAAAAAKQQATALELAAELANIIPFARGIDRQQPVLHMTQPPKTQLVSASTYHVLTWGKDGHRKILHAYAPKLCYEAAMHSELCYKAARCSGEISATICDVPFTEKDVAAYRHEWDQLPYCVPDGVSVPLEVMEQDALHVAKVGRWTAGASSATCLTPTTCSSSSGAPVAFVENSQQPVESSPAMESSHAVESSQQLREVLEDLKTTRAQLQLVEEQLEHERQAAREAREASIGRRLYALEVQISRTAELMKQVKRKELSRPLTLELRRSSLAPDLLHEAATKLQPAHMLFANIHVEFVNEPGRDEGALRINAFAAFHERLYTQAR